MALLRTFSVLTLGLVVLALVVGCGDQAASKKPHSEHNETKSAKKTSVVKGEEEHAHKPTAHGGSLISIGSDSYHAEAVFEKGGTVRLYTLGKDEARVLEVEAQPLIAFVKIEGLPESESLTLAPKPQQGDAQGKTSLFVGELPKSAVGKKFEVVIPLLRIGSERFRLTIASPTTALSSTAAPAHGTDHNPPSKVVDESEKKLYLTPGGKYTQADIKANGNQTASQKFQGLKAEHDSKPKPGDKICPISLTKANAQFHWIIDGKTYEFCCPPCVDEFLQLAKEKPGEIKPPEAYRQK